MVAEKKLYIIRGGGLRGDYWTDLWRHREILFFLAWRDILVRYKQTVVGVSWVVIRPLLTMVILSTVFGRLANLPSANVPYTILVFTGLLPWFFFSNSLSECSNSLITNANLLSKVYFPRMIVPASSILVSAVDFCISLGILFALMLWYGVAPSWRLLALPVLGAWVGLLAFGIGLGFAALNVRYRDFRHIVPFLLQLGVYASPVGYLSSIIPERWDFLYYINPVAGLIDSFRWAIIGAPLKSYGVITAICVTILFFVGSVRYFRVEELRFADDI